MNNKTNDIPKGAFPYICRTCLLFTDDDEIFSITNFSWEGILLKDILLAYTGIEMEENCSARSMCKTCIKKLFEVDRFIKKCQGSNDLLKSIYFEEHSKVLHSLNQNESSTQTSNIEICFIEDDKESDDFEEVLLKEEEEYTNRKSEDMSSNWHYYDSKEENNTVEIPCETDISNQKLINTVHMLKSELKPMGKEYISRKEEKLGPLLTENYQNVNNRRSSTRSRGLPYTCVTCHASFDEYDEWKNHCLETKHHSALKYKCPYCPKVGFRSSSMAEHVRSHTGEKPNKCPMCNKGFNGKSVLTRHMISKHAEVKPYKCKLCDKSFVRKQYLVDHERKHTGEVLLCSTCGKGCHSQQTLWKHERIHKGKGISRKESPQICQICNKKFSSPSTLNAHMPLHGPKDLICETCGKAYTSKLKLKQHIGYAHKEPKFPCTLCDKVYKQKYDLQTHMNVHTGEKMYCCDMCDKTFAYRGSLQDHRRIHTGDTRYQCKVCLKICLNKRFLESHMRIHTGEKPYICDHCGRRFAFRSNMNQHVKIHRGERNHSCEICGKSFFNSRTLKKHTATHLKN